MKRTKPRVPSSSASSGAAVRPHPDLPPFDPAAWPGGSLREKASAWAWATAQRIGRERPGDLAFNAYMCARRRAGLAQPRRDV